MTVLPLLYIVGLCAALACAAAAGLLFLHDIHGAAFLLGLTLAAVLRWLR